MKTANTKRNYHLNVEVRRGLFAWATLAISILALVTYLVYSFKFIGYAIVIDSIITVSSQSLIGMTAKMEADLELNRELQNHCLMMLLKFVPLYVATFLALYIWKGSSKNFIKSLLFKWFSTKRDQLFLVFFVTILY